jgi:hypothetical protein
MNPNRPSYARYVAPVVEPAPTRQRVREAPPVQQAVRRQTVTKQPSPVPVAKAKIAVPKARSKRRSGKGLGMGSVVTLAVSSSLLTLLFCISAVVGLMQGSNFVSRLLDAQARQIASAVRVEVENRTADNNALQQPKSSALPQKGSITGSVAFKELPASIATDNGNQATTAADNQTVEDVSTEEEQQDTGFQSAAASLPEGLPRMLKKGRSGLTIGNFRSATLEGAAEECVDLGYSMLSDAKAPNDLLDILVATEQITISKICAANGSIIFTCRAGKITISPRRKKPNDGCTQA